MMQDETTITNSLDPATFRAQGTYTCRYCGQVWLVNTPLGGPLCWTPGTSSRCAPVGVWTWPVDADVPACGQVGATSTRCVPVGGFVARLEPAASKDHGDGDQHNFDDDGDCMECGVADDADVVCKPVEFRLEAANCFEGFGWEGGKEETIEKVMAAMAKIATRPHGATETALPELAEQKCADLLVLCNESAAGMAKAEAEVERLRERNAALERCYAGAKDTAREATTRAERAEDLDAEREDGDLKDEVDRLRAEINTWRHLNDASCLEIDALRSYPPHAYVDSAHVPGSCVVCARAACAAVNKW